MTREEAHALLRCHTWGCHQTCLRDASGSKGRGVSSHVLRCGPHESNARAFFTQQYSHLYRLKRWFDAIWNFIPVSCWPPKTKSLWFLLNLCIKLNSHLMADQINFSLWIPQIKPSKKCVYVISHFASHQVTKAFTARSAIAVLQEEEETTPSDAEWECGPCTIDLAIGGERLLLSLRCIVLLKQFMVVG